RIFVNLLASRKDAVLQSLAIGNDEILAAADPGLATGIADLRVSPVEQRQLRTKKALVHPLRLRGLRPSRQGRSRIACIIHVGLSFDSCCAALTPSVAPA